jgi:ABC-2 type transport system permease protein
VNRLWSPTWQLTRRALVQFPRIPSVLVFSMIPPIVQFLLFGSIFGDLPDSLPTFPTDNYYAYLAPAIVFFTTVIGVANAGMALVRDFRNGYFRKLLLAPINRWAILLGRLLADGVRVYVQAGLILLLALAFDASVATGVLGALVMLAVSTLFSLFTVGVLVANVGLRTKNEEAVQSIFPVFFIAIFLTTAFLPKESIGSELVNDLIDLNPAEYVIRPMRELMLTGWDVPGLLLALGITATSAVLGVLVTAWNFSTVYE